MTMYFKYGAYQHADGEVNLTTITHRRMYSGRNRLMWNQITLTAIGEFCLSTQADIKTAITDLQNAYADDGEDAALYHSDGTRSAHFLTSATSIDGVKVLTLDYPTGEPGEYASGRTFRIVLQAEYLNIESELLEFSEMLRFTGNTGPRHFWYDTFNGDPGNLQAMAQTTQKIVQEGRALGLQGYPIEPPPFLPVQFQHQERFVLERYSPVSYRNMFLQYPVVWRYEFESPVLLLGAPGRE